MNNATRLLLHLLRLGGLLLALHVLAPGPAQAQSLPSGWTATDVGGPVIPGYATFANDTYRVSGAGTGVRGTADQFTFAYRQITGDATVVAYVGSLLGSLGSAEVGLMMRHQLGAGAPHAALLASPTNGLSFKRRSATAGSTTSTTVARATPVWLRLERQGASVIASWSNDGATWTVIGTQPLPIGNSFYVGMAVSSGLAVAPTIGTFTGVQVRTLLDYGGPLPSGWASQDIGAPGRPGRATYTAGVFAIEGGGTDIDGTSDQFRFAYSEAPGDVDIVARVRDLGNSNALSKAGIMIRDSLTPTGAHASMLVSSAGGTMFRRRESAGAASQTTAGSASPAPIWMKLSLRNGSVTSSQSLDGVSWTIIGTAALTLGSPYYVGLAVTSRDNSSTVVANVESVSVTIVNVPNTAPSVSLTEPSGATYAAPATITVSAAATDQDGTVARVEFFQGTTLIGSDTSSPYSISWTNVTAGTYSLTAVATDDDGATTTSAARTITVDNAPNQMPTVALTSPASGASFTAQATVTVSANAGDTDGTVARVDFFQGTTLLASDTASPYSVSWTNVPAGTYSLTAVATDNAGGTTTSAAHSITVTAAANQPPAVSLTSPTSGASFPAGSTITVSANASDNDGTVAKVDFYRGTTLIGTDTTSPYSVAWTNAPAGTHSLTAVATDNAGGATTSMGRSITVNAAANQPPAVSLTSPAGGALFPVGSTITINANASDSDGTIAKVDFYRDSTLIGSDAGSPYSVTWANVPAGTYTLTAIATDNTGVTTTSAGHTITVSTTTTQRNAIFTPSADHDMLVNFYRLDVFATGANPATATPIATQNLGKPAPAGNEISADITATLNGLAAGNYQATVSAVGGGGSARSAAATFTK